VSDRFETVLGYVRKRGGIMPMFCVLDRPTLCLSGSGDSCCGHYFGWENVKVGQHNLVRVKCGLVTRLLEKKK